jgi:RNA polymerase sigma-70 factor (ECF subfamily)
LIDQYIKQYGKRLYGLCITLCATTFDADDLYQETWLKVVKNIDRYDPTKSFEPWLTTICVNTYRNKLRWIARSPIINRFSAFEEKAAVDALSVRQKEQECDYTSLYKAIDNLPDKLRMTVILFYFRDMDIASTAQVLGIPVGTVKSRLNKSRKLLKEALSHETDIRF